MNVAVIPLKVMPRFSLKTFGLILTIAALIVLAAVTKLRHDNRVGSLELEILALSKHSEELARETEGLRQRIESVINQLCQLLETEGMTSAPLDGNATSHSIAVVIPKDQSSENCIRSVESSFDAINAEHDERYALTVPSMTLNGSMHFVVRLR